MSELKLFPCLCGKEPTLKWHAGTTFGGVFTAPHYTISCECGATMHECVLKPIYAEQQKAKNRLVRRWNRANRRAE